MRPQHVQSPDLLPVNHSTPLKECRKTKTSENGAELPEESLFVQGLGLSGTMVTDSTTHKKSWYWHSS